MDPLKQLVAGWYELEQQLELGPSAGEWMSVLLTVVGGTIAIPPLLLGPQLRARDLLHYYVPVPILVLGTVFAPFSRAVAFISLTVGIATITILAGRNLLKGAQRVRRAIEVLAIPSEVKEVALILEGDRPSKGEPSPLSRMHLDQLVENLRRLARERQSLNQARESIISRLSVADRVTADTRSAEKTADERDVKRLNREIASIDDTVRSWSAKLEQGRLDLAQATSAASATSLKFPELWPSDFNRNSDSRLQEVALATFASALADGWGAMEVTHTPPRLEPRDGEGPTIHFRKALAPEVPIEGILFPVTVIADAIVQGPKGRGMLLVVNQPLEAIVRKAWSALLKEDSSFLVVILIDTVTNDLAAVRASLPTGHGEAQAIPEEYVGRGERYRPALRSVKDLARKLA